MSSPRWQGWVDVPAGTTRTAAIRFEVDARSLRPDRPALRHKDLGIWQTWTWAQVLDEVRAYAVGLHRLGLRRGE